ncbi:MAG: hypothetical protein KDE46_12805, partial [Caldilineaceae bacterium]|nr:hypothetical protein [Caldilineaceae bacterium]
ADGARDELQSFVIKQFGDAEGIGVVQPVPILALVASWPCHFADDNVPGVRGYMYHQFAVDMYHRFAV